MFKDFIRHLLQCISLRNAVDHDDHEDIMKRFRLMCVQQWDIVQPLHFPHDWFNKLQYRIMNVCVCVLMKWKRDQNA